METIKELSKRMSQVERTSEELLRILKRIDARQAKEAHRPEKQTWVKVGTVAKLTGWNHRQLEIARKNGMIKRKRSDNGFWYLLESIPERLLINKTTAV